MHITHAPENLLKCAQSWLGRPDAQVSARSTITLCNLDKEGTNSPVCSETPKCFHFLSPMTWPSLSNVCRWHLHHILSATPFSSNSLKLKFFSLCSKNGLYGWCACQYAYQISSPEAEIKGVKLASLKSTKLKAIKQYQDNPKQALNITRQSRKHTQKPSLPS